MTQALERHQCEKCAVQEAHLTWEELTHGPTNQEKQLLIQAIAILSTQPAFEKMTIWEVYDKVVDNLRVIPA